jgi:DNA-binding response OmpR family regulator
MLAALPTPLGDHCARAPLRAAASHHLGLVVLDLPDMDGVEVNRGLRGNR